MVVKNNCLLVLEYGTDYSWSFLKEKSELKDMIFALLKDLKSIQSIDVGKQSCWYQLRCYTDRKGHFTTKYKNWVKICYAFNRVWPMLNKEKLSHFMLMQQIMQFYWKLFWQQQKGSLAHINNVWEGKMKHFDFIAKNGWNLHNDPLWFEALSKNFQPR